MCGIAGYIDHVSNIGRERFRQAVTLLSHRGPDAEGFHFGHTYGLGHRRLSIIDLTEAANQPMVSRSGMSAVVFNGEIYNFREIAAGDAGKYRTRSDTEVLLEVFEQSGPEAISRLNGMFAAAVADTRKGEMTLFRDRLGIKPLYYYFSGGLFVFASELKTMFSLLADHTLHLDRMAVNAYLRMGFIPEPMTICSEIRQLRAGHFLWTDGFMMQETPYWDPGKTLSAQTLDDPVEAGHQLHELLKDSIRYRLIADVPFGTFLSGGIDSSLVTAIAAGISPGLKTFTIGFTDPVKDESHYAREVASILGSRHTEIMISEQDALDSMEKAMDLFDQPYADSSALPTLLVSRLAADHVKMVLSGDGGDELFHGYGAYKWAERLQHPLWRHLGPRLSPLLSLGNARYRRAGKMLSMTRPDGRQLHIFSQEQYLFTGKELQTLLLPGFRTKQEYLPVMADLPRSLTPSEIQALWDIRYYLKDDLLVKTDRTSMSASLECRLPLLDHRIVSWALNLHPSLKTREGQTKSILRSILAQYLPERLFYRPKQGFSVPLSAWLKGPLHYLLDEYLDEQRVRKENILNFEQVTSLRKQYENKACNDFLYNRLWALIILRKHLVKLNLNP
ncbi:MAG TPA: asparagine synthase (glutamine-hydrolyzing) [Bacteroidales bacterium]|nr:asparagine synthase (glutamine-hydrolyzing) [Bacteroidales bacterium]HSA43494.1 asparagine synthase (glutamine-hydrolyzing) [Bacteroidales bacterium]